ncbi:hypothetical protein CC79DRAFT_1327443 [Sarocladium strictum]
MYKKRFAKWGFYKNATLKRWDGYHARELSSPPRTMAFTTADPSTTTLFDSIKLWTSSFFYSDEFEQSLATREVWTYEAVQALSGRGPTLPYDPEKANCAFRLEAMLLQDGQGVLAGRLARMAFIQVEETMFIGGPSYIWNLLDTMHAILQMGQDKLFNMLLLHLIRLSSTDFACQSHPATLILRSLMQLSQGWSSETEAGYLADGTSSNTKVRVIQALIKTRIADGLNTSTVGKVKVRVDS